MTHFLHFSPEDLQRIEDVLFYEEAPPRYLYPHYRTQTSSRKSCVRSEITSKRHPATLHSKSTEKGAATEETGNGDHLWESESDPDDTGRFEVMKRELLTERHHHENTLCVGCEGRKGTHVVPTSATQGSNTQRRPFNMRSNSYTQRRPFNTRSNSNTQRRPFNTHGVIPSYSCGSLYKEHSHRWASSKLCLVKLKGSALFPARNSEASLIRTFPFSLHTFRQNDVFLPLKGKIFLCLA